MSSRPLPPADLDHVVCHAADVFRSLRGARLFLTGGTGFFGHWIVESLLHADRDLSLGVRVTVLTRNAASFRARSPHLADCSAITLLEGDIRGFAFPAEQHTHVIHAATDSGGQQADQPAYALAEAILEGTRRTLQFALATGAERMLFTSTGAVYGRSAPLPHIAETYRGAPDPLLLGSSYDEAKRMAEHLCVAYSHGTSLGCAIARPFAFVGPHLPLDTHFAIGNFTRAAMAGEAIVVRGDGTPRRSYLYAADLAIWLWHLLVRAPANRAYNVGSPEGLTIAELARLTAETLRPGAGLPVEVLGTADAAAPLNSYVPDVQRAASELGLSVTVPLAEAIRRTAAWHGFVPEAG